MNAKPETAGTSLALGASPKHTTLQMAASNAMPNERVYPRMTAEQKKYANAKQEAAKSRKIREGLFNRKSVKKTKDKVVTNENEDQNHQSGEGAEVRNVVIYLDERKTERVIIKEMNTYSERNISSELGENHATSNSVRYDDNSSSEVTEELVILHHDFGCIQPGVLSEELKAKIVSKGSLYFQNIDDEYLFPKELVQDGQQSLMSSWFTSKLPLGKTCNRSWLIFSPSLKCFFCFSCILFSEAPENIYSPLSKLGVGFTKWNKPETLKEHEEAIYHRRAFLKWKLAEEKIREGEDELSRMFHDQIQKNQKFWRDILKRVAAAVKFLSKSYLSFLGHRETLQHASPGNVLSSLKFLAEFDDVMRLHLERIEFGKTHYLSADILNEFIDLMGNNVRDLIVEKVKQAHYFSLMVDCTLDVSHQKQLSLIIRYLDSSDFEVKESFLGFFKIGKPDSQDYEELVLKALEDLGLDFTLCRGQTYNSAATMRGYVSGLQKCLLDINPKASIVNCDNHSLNLAALHSAEVDPAIVTFFETIQEFFNFFAHSPKRWTKMNNVGAGGLKMENNSRWSARAEATKAVSLHLERFIQILKELAECTSEEVDTRSNARNLHPALENYDFFVYLKFWVNILRPFNLAQKKLQLLGASVKEAVEEMETLSCFLVNEKEREKLITLSIKYAEQGSNCYGFPRIRRVRKKKMFDVEGRSDEGLPMEVDFRRVAIKVLDRLYREIKERSQRLKDHDDRFGFLLQTDLLLRSMSEETLQKHCADFACFYDEVQPKSLFHDIIDARVLFLNKEVPETPEDILKKLSAYGNDVCPSLTTAIRISITLATSIASCERSFSKLTMVKSHLQSIGGQDRLSSLVLMSIESDLLDKIDIDDLIDDFAAKKAKQETV